MLKGRITKGIGGLYFVDTENGIFECSLRGIFRKDKIVPTVGDYVEIGILNESGNTQKAIIEKILQRKNILIRPKVSNIDCVIITFSIQSPNINIDLLNRFLILAENENIPEIIICINKCDLSNENELNHIQNIYKNIYKLIIISTKEDINIALLKENIKDKVVVFAGPSGVGKSTIINKIIPDANLKIGEISKKIKRGKHTTRQVELLKASENTFIVDSPGFTSLDISFIPKENIQYMMKEFSPYIGSCKFCDCVHLQEPMCAIKNELDVNITYDRYDFYKKLMLEENYKND